MDSFASRSIVIVLLLLYAMGARAQENCDAGVVALTKEKLGPLSATTSQALQAPGREASLRFKKIYFKTPRLTVRPSMPRDEEAYLSIAQHPLVQKMENIAPSAAGEERERFRDFLKAGPAAKPDSVPFMKSIVDEKTGKVIGYVGGVLTQSRANKDAVLFYGLHPDYQRQGYMSEVMPYLLQALKKFGEVTTAHAYVFESNRGSRRILESAKMDNWGAISPSSVGLKPQRAERLLHYSRYLGNRGI